MTVTTLDISAAEFPTEKTYTFSNRTYLFKFRKNIFGDYVVEIWSADGRTFLYANKIVYGQNIIDTIKAPFQDKIVPLCISLITSDNGTKEINDTTLGDAVQLVTAIDV